MQIFRDKNGLWNTIEYLLWTFDLEQYPGLNWRSDYNAYPLSASTLFIKSVGHILLISRSAHRARWPWVRNGYTLTPTKLVKERGMDVGWCYTDKYLYFCPTGICFLFILWSFQQEASRIKRPSHLCNENGAQWRLTKIWMEHENEEKAEGADSCK